MRNHFTGIGIMVLSLVTVCQAADHPYYASYRVSFEGGSGSATAIGERLLLTNWHVAGAAGRTGQAKSASGEVVNIRCVVSTPSYDLALCETEATAKPLRWAAIAGAPPAADQEVQFYGYGAGGSTLRVAHGEYMGKAQGQNYWSAIVQSGDSGGGFFDAAGRLIGVNARTDNAFPPAGGQFFQGHSLSVPLVQVKDFVAQHTQSCPDGSCQRGGGGSQPSRRPPPRNWPQPAEPPADPPVVPVVPKPDVPVTPPPVAPPKVEVVPGPPGPQGPAGPPGKDADQDEIVAKVVQAVMAEMAKQKPEVPSGTIKEEVRKAIAGHLRVTVEPLAK